MTSNRLEDITAEDVEILWDVEEEIAVEVESALRSSTLAVPELLYVPLKGGRRHLYARGEDAAQLAACAAFAEGYGEGYTAGSRRS